MAMPFLLVGNVVKMLWVHIFPLGGRERTALTAWGQQHAGAAINAVLENDEFVVSGKMVFVYAVQAPLLGRATHAVAVAEQTGIRMLATLSSSGIDGVVILGNVQAQEMVVGEVVMAIAASVHVGLEVVDVVLVKRGKFQQLMGR